MEIILENKNTIKETINGLDSKISEYEKNHKDGKGKYYTLGEVNTILDKAIKTGR